jgi:Domain of unknown function (DUF222)
VSWTPGLSIGQVLTAARRHERHRAGGDLAAWGEPGCTGQDEAPAGGEPGPGLEDDERGQEAIMAADEDLGRVLSFGELGGHAVMAPGPDLAGWLACCRASDRDDAALVNSITAWRKVTSWAQAQELAAVAELARRRRVAGAADATGEGRSPAADAGLSSGDRVAELEAGFAPNEVALALTLTQGGAEYWMDLAVSLSRRLPATLAALAEGTVDLNRAKLIDQFTGTLDAALARAVERRVLDRAQHQTSGQLRASLQRAVLAVDPAAAERRRKEAERKALVALFGDHDGTASLSGRCLPAAQAAAAWARICAMAKAMEAAGAGGGMDLLRAQVYVGLLLGTLPLIPPADGAPDDEGPDDEGSDGGAPGDGGTPAAGNGPWGDAGYPRDEDAPYDMRPGWEDPGRGDPGGPPPAWPPLPLPGATPAPGCARPARAGPATSQDRRGPPGSPRQPAKPRQPGSPRSPGGSRLAGRAMLCVPWRTLAGWSSEPGELGRIGPVTAGTARDLAPAASADVTCEWRVVVAGRSGRALAVARVRRTSVGTNPAAAPGVVGRVTLTIPAGLLGSPAGRTAQAGLPGPVAMLAARDLAGSGTLAKMLEAALRAGAKAFSARQSRTGPGSCTHEEASPGYRIPDPMRALVEARDQTCGFPTCRQPDWRCEQDHTVAYRLGGATCPCNLSSECARHHHLKHLPRWRLDQPRPGVLTWTTPARLTHTVMPGRYPA